MSPGKVYLLDANLILRFLLDDHPDFNSRARAFFRALHDGEKNALVLDCVLAECVYVLEKFYRVQRREIEEKLSAILQFAGIIGNDSRQLGDALRLYARKKVDIVDAILISKSAPDRPIASWDDDIRKLTRNLEKI